MEDYLKTSYRKELHDLVIENWENIYFSKQKLAAWIFFYRELFDLNDTANFNNIALNCIRRLPRNKKVKKLLKDKGIYTIITDNSFLYDKVFKAGHFPSKIKGK